VNSSSQSLDDKSPQQQYDNYLLCAEHFEPSQFMSSATRSSLIHCTVPTIFNVPKPPRALSLKRSTPSAQFGLQVPANKRLTVSGESDSGATSAIQESRSTTVAEPLTPRKAELTSKLVYSRKCLARPRTCLFRNRTTPHISTEQGVLVGAVK